MKWCICSRDVRLFLECLDLFLVGLLQLVDAAFALLSCFALQLLSVFFEDLVGALVCGEEAHIVYLGPAALIAAERRRARPGSPAEDRCRVVDGDHVEIGPALHERVVDREYECDVALDAVHLLHLHTFLIWMSAPSQRG